MVNAISQLIDLLSTHYDIGELASYEQLQLGYVNASFIIETVASGESHKYFIRQYKQGLTKGEIEFEHSIIKHLVNKSFDLVAGVINNRDGKTYIKRIDKYGDPSFYAVFDFLQGDDKYTWVNPHCDDEDLISSAIVLAQYHNAIYDLIPKGYRDEPKIIDLLPEIAQTVEQCAQKAGKTVFDRYFLENVTLIQETIQGIQRVLEKDEYKKLFQLVIHCDYHPGNLKFQNGEITGLFDFDWSKVDVRCFDVALAMTYFCVAWEGKQDGDLQLKKVAVFSDAYQNILRNTPDLEPICDIELEFLPYLIGASNIYILHWTIRDFYDTEVDPHEYLIYLQHSIRFMRWLENKDNWGQLKRMLKS